MAFFRKWKTHYKHKKFTSDDIIETDDWGLDKSIKDLDMKLNNDYNFDDNEDDVKDLSASYNIKYLGCTPIEVKRSEKVTSEAIKTVIANSKAGGRKNKTHKRVQLNVSQDGIEVLDEQTKESLMRFSIYKISYCSVDAAHDHAFSFVGSEKDPLCDEEKMSCHVFYCAKRKIAHEITLMVARCFENAYQHWRDSVVQHTKMQSVHPADSGIKAQEAHVLKEQNGDTNDVGVIKSQAEVYQPKCDNLLIDLAATDSDVRKFLQNTWVSFEDDSHEGVQILAC